MAELIEIDTERLRLRKWSAADRAPFAALSADARVMEFFPAPLDRAQSDAMAHRCQALIAERGWGLWAVQTRYGGEFIGYVGLHETPPELHFSPAVEVGWRLAFDYWGRGFAAEAARAVLRVGFERLHLTQIVSFTAVINTRSRAVMQRLGMCMDAEHFQHPRLPPGHVLREHCLYRLSRQQWAASAD